MLAVVMTKEILAVTGMRTSPLYGRTSKIVHDVDEKLTKLIHKWRFFKAGPPMVVKKYDGSEICYQGLKFSGTPVLVFWNDFIEPYIENYSIKILEQTSALSFECQFPVEDSIEEAKNLLLVMVRRIYHEMSETDQILRGDGFTFPERKDVSSQIESMSLKISEHAEIEKMKKPSLNQTIFNIDHVSGEHVHVGIKNNNTIDGINEYFRKIALSGEQEAITLLALILKNDTSKNLIGLEATTYLLSILKNKL